MLNLKSIHFGHFRCVCTCVHVCRWAYSCSLYSTLCSYASCRSCYRITLCDDAVDEWGDCQIEQFNRTLAEPPFVLRLINERSIARHHSRVARCRRASRLSHDRPAMIGRLRHLGVSSPLLFHDLFFPDGPQESPDAMKTHQQTSADIGRQFVRGYWQRNHSPSRLRYGYVID